MRRFLAHALGFLAIQAAILSALSVFYVRRVQQDHYLLAWKDKQERLRTTVAPRLILCGGSSSAFGTNSRRLQQAFHRPVVNLGLHGGLGLEFMLRQVEASAGSGDVIVLAPEYEILQEGGQGFTATTILDLLSLTVEPVRYLGRRQLMLALDRGLDVIAKRPRALYLFLRGELEPQPSHLRRSSFNVFGDVIANRGAGSATLTDRIASRITAEDVRDSIPRLRLFSSRLRDRGVELCLLPPPIPESSYALYHEHLDAAWQSIVEGVGGCTLSVRPLAYPDAAFHLNNGYHLNRPGGVSLRMNDLVEGLRAAQPGLALVRRTDR